MSKKIGAWKIDKSGVDYEKPDFEFLYPGSEDDCCEWGYDLINEELETHLQSINASRFPYVCCVNNFGWRLLNGVKKIELKEESRILNAFLPDTECYFKIWLTPAGFLLQNFHHDSCDGSEWYEVRVEEDEE